jgi:EF hand
MENLMTKSALPRTILLAALFASGVTAAASAQKTTADPHHPTLTVVQAAPEETAGQSGGLQPAQPGTMPPGMMMGQGMMGGMMQPGMMSAMPMMSMRGHMMKIMFAVADVDGDGGLSFEEVATIHKRIFDKVDANKDGKVTPEEFQLFMRE